MVAVMAALAQPVDDEDVDLEIEVVAEDVEAAREGLTRSIRDQGYLPGVRLGKRTVYLHPQIWKGSVVVRERTQEVRVRVPAAVPLGVKYEDGVAEATFLHATRRERRSMKAERMDRLMPAVQKWRDATAARGEVLAIRRAMDRNGAVWFDPALSLEQRCRELVTAYDRTLPYGVGAEVRSWTQRFVWEVVQKSSEPCPVEQLMEVGLVSPRPARVAL